jgi:hypothetical protein
MKQNSTSFPNPAINETLLTLGWVILVPGQSMVLYSRLHLISQNRHLLRFIFWFILVDALLLCGPCIVLNSGQYSSNPKPYTDGYVVMEKIQMTMFTVQEFFISGVYVWEIRKVLKVIFKGQTRKIMWQLVAMNVLIVCLDVSMLIVIGFGYYMLETTMKAMIYSVKLKVEFAVLTKMVSVFTHRQGANRVAGVIQRGSTNSAKILDPEKSPSAEAPGMDTQMSQQENLPPNWRMSIDQGASEEPDLIEVQRRHQSSQDDSKDSLSSVENLYPGRLDPKTSWGGNIRSQGFAVEVINELDYQHLRNT